MDVETYRQIELLLRERDQARALYRQSEQARRVYEDATRRTIATVVARAEKAENQVKALRDILLQD